MHKSILKGYTAIRETGRWEKNICRWEKNIYCPMSLHLSTVNCVNVSSTQNFFYEK